VRNLFLVAARVIARRLRRVRLVTPVDCLALSASSTSAQCLPQRRGKALIIPDTNLASTSNSVLRIVALRYHNDRSGAMLHPGVRRSGHAREFPPAGWFRRICICQGDASNSWAIREFPPAGWFRRICICQGDA